MIVLNTCNYLKMSPFDIQYFNPRKAKKDKILMINPVCITAFSFLFKKYAKIAIEKKPNR